MKPIETCKGYEDSCKERANCDGCHDLDIRGSETLDPSALNGLLSANWIAIDKFKPRTEVDCWIVYKGKVVRAYQDHHGVFRFSKNSNCSYMTECITYAQCIVCPEAPSR